MPAARPPRPFLVPGPALRPWVERIWTLSGDAATPLPRLLPGTGAELVLHLGAPLCVADPAGGLRRLAPAHLIVSRRGAPQLVADGPFELVAVRLRTGALRRLSDVAPADLEDRLAPAEEALGEDAVRLLRTAAGAPGPRARARELERALGLLLRRRGARVEAADLALERLYRRAGRERVRDAARALGTSQRQLERTVRAAFGHGPKRLQRLARFHHVIRRLLLAGDADYLGPALDGGFYDQAHFVHEARALTGCAPGRLLTPAAFASHFYNPPLAPAGEPPREREAHDDGDG